MIRSGKEVLERIKDKWLVVHDELGWHIEKDAAEVDISMGAVNFLFDHGYIRPIAKRTVYELARCKT